MDAPSDKVCSKGRPAGQWSWRGGLLALVVGLAVVAATACHRHGGSATTPAAAARPTPSGLPVPRYVSLKFAKVNARQGPGDDYRLLWVYRVKGLPLQVVAETDDWRRVCDPDGQTSWVHKRTVAERRTVMRTQAQDLLLRRSPGDGSAASATLVGRALAELKTCRDGWCRISAGHASGWVRPDEVWGLADTLQCRE